MKRSKATLLITTGLIATMSTQVFAIAMVDENAVDKNVQVGNTVTTSILLAAPEQTSVVEPVTTSQTVNIAEVESSSFVGLTPLHTYEVTFVDSTGATTLVQTILVFDEAGYYTDTKIARPEPYMNIDDKLYVSMKAENPYTENTEDYNNFEDFANTNYDVIENQITDLDKVNEVFTILYGDELSTEYLENFKFIQNPVTNKMTILDFEMYAPKTENSNEYDLAAKFTYTVGGDVTVRVPMIQDTALDPTFVFTQKLILNHEAIAEKGVIKDGILYLPARAFGDLTNHTVYYNPKTKTVTFKKGLKEYETAYNASVASKSVDGEKVGVYDLTYPLYMEDGVGYVPVNFFTDIIDA